MKSKKRFLRFITSMVMVMAMLVTTVFSDGMITRAATVDTVTIRFHYQRSDNSYDKWNVWGWQDGGSGAWYAFDQRDENGYGVAVIEDVPVQAGKFGYIISTTSWDKDYGSDRFVDLTKATNNVIDVFAKAGIAAVTTEYTDDIFAFKSAQVSGENELTIATRRQITDQDDVHVYDVTSKETEITDITLNTVDENTLKVTLNGSKIKFGSKYKVTCGESTYSVSAKYDYDSSYFEDTYTYDGNDLGAEYTNSATTFKTWSPNAESLSVLVYDKGTKYETENEQATEYEMTGGTAKDKGVWSVTVPGNLKDKYYIYKVNISGSTNYCMDPYAVSGSTVTDNYVTDTSRSGQRGMITDLSATDPKGWSEDAHVITKNKTDASIYELSIRDFSSDPESGISEANQKKYLAFTENGTTLRNEGKISTGIDYIKNLGVSYIQIMPMYDFAGTNEVTGAGYNWGYNPVNYNIPEGSFSSNPKDGNVRVNECKQMVQAIHNNGMGVIMDVVYNHVNNDKTFCFNQLVPGYFFRGSNGSGCGNDVASERPMVRKFIVDSVKYWAEEYHIDGFRFDLVGLLDVDTMNEIRAELNKINPEILVYGEGWSLSTSPVKNVSLATQGSAKDMPGVGMFNDVIRSAIRGGNDSSSKGYATGNTGSISDMRKSLKGQNWFSNDPTQVINYISCHDNYTLWDKITKSTPGAWVSTRTRMNKLAAALNISAQGIPLFQAGEEFLRTKGGNENSYNSTDKVNMLDWSLVEDNADVVDYYAGLLKFRNAHAALRMTTESEISKKITTLTTTNNIIAYTIDGSATGETAQKLLVAFNPNLGSKTMTLPAGEWNLYVDGDTAGTDVLNKVSGTLTMDEYSAYILTQGEATGKTGVQYSDVKIDDSKCVYDGSKQEPAVTISCLGKSLVKGTDYLVDYSDNVNAGTATVTITGKGNYSGKTVRTFTIKKASMTLAVKCATVTYKSSLAPYYGGYKGNGKITYYYKKYGAADSTYTTTKPVNVGKYTVKMTVAVTANYYSATATCTAVINPKSITGAKVSGVVSSKNYTGSSIKQTGLIVKLGTLTLKNGTDYSIIYSNNKNIGTATVKIKGKGNYTGTISKSFKIIIGKPSYLKVTTPSKKNVKVSWARVTGASGYEVYVATSKSGKYKKLKTISGVSKVSYSYGGLKSGKTYYYKVRAYKKVGSSNKYSSYTTDKSVKVK